MDIPISRLYLWDNVSSEDPRFSRTNAHLRAGNLSSGYWPPNTEMRLFWLGEPELIQPEPKLRFWSYPIFDKRTQVTKPLLITYYTPGGPKPSEVPPPARPSAREYEALQRQFATQLEGLIEGLDNGYVRKRREALNNIEGPLIRAIGQALTERQLAGVWEDEKAYIDKWTRRADFVGGLVWMGVSISKYTTKLGDIDVNLKGLREEIGELQAQQKRIRDSILSRPNKDIGGRSFSVNGGEVFDLARAIKAGRLQNAQKAGEIYREHVQAVFAGKRTAGLYRAGAGQDDPVAFALTFISPPSILAWATGYFFKYLVPVDTAARVAERSLREEQRAIGEYMEVLRGKYSNLEVITEVSGFVKITAPGYESRLLGILADKKKLVDKWAEDLAEAERRKREPLFAPKGVDWAWLLEQDALISEELAVITDIFATIEGAFGDFDRALLERASLRKAEWDEIRSWYYTKGFESFRDPYGLWLLELSAEIDILKKTLGQAQSLVDDIADQAFFILWADLPRPDR